MPESRIKDRHDLLNVERAARMTGLSRPTIIKRLRDGEISGERICEWFFVSRADVERLARERLNVPTINA